MRFVAICFEGMLSFGAPAVGQVRPTDIFPACSMIAGLIANALGYEHYEREKIQVLQQAITMGTRIDVSGERFVDYQTAAIDKKRGLWRSDKLMGAEDETFEGTTLRYKHYLVQKATTSIVGFREGTWPDWFPSLDDVAEAMKKPFRVLFLGRYCCIPFSPLFRATLCASSVYEGLQQIGDEKNEGALGEWPVFSDVEEPRGARRMERQDLRDWVNDIHTGNRVVWRGHI